MYRPLHIAIAQCQVSLVQYLTQMTLASGISLDIYNKLKQVTMAANHVGYILRNELSMCNRKSRVICMYLAYQC